MQFLLVNLPRTIHRNHRIQRQPGNVQMFSNGSNVDASIICEKGANTSLSDPDDSSSVSIATLSLQAYIDSVHDNSSISEQSQLQII